MSLIFTGQIIEGKIERQQPTLFAVFHNSAWGMTKKNPNGKPQETIMSQRICEHLLTNASKSDAKQLREAIAHIKTRGNHRDPHESTESLFSEIGMGHG